mmetsp:Transcript_30604/g.50024  ORF Transcript_30604/g.50024 Transcript_30604/m.50024 type:complete len:175 (+) Transcript_30604:149-673(+)|eukprot:CAMPEP_0201955876 /NCGR_PEP_ID=MMETSP0904-20121228/3312_1 /ASSEMBLY_ACC=CAM_ASM_000553 /TAXON_ID=420261 /ORGANISM="Thalassiosira antarctica, Strain CCMP982" /LENGTH=174 /DNA_ID=CAMNT_0048500123 /DNA_START=126 /DNA_END=650 /DNA_ORIENTATION=-
MGDEVKVNEFVLSVTATFTIEKGEEEEENETSFSLQNSLQEDEASLHRACAEVIISYIQHNASEVFSTISNKEYWEEGGDAFELNGEVTVNRDLGRVSFPFRRTRDGDVEKIVEEISVGGDTWDCGNFGDVNAANVEAVDWNRWIGGCSATHTGMSIRMFLGVEPEVTEVALVV